MKVKLTKEEAKQILSTFKTQYFASCRNYVTVCKVDPEWVKEILPAPLEPDEPLVTFALCVCDEFTGLVGGVQCKYNGIVGNLGLAYVMDTDIAVRIGREGLGEPKKQGETVIHDDGKKYIGTVSRLGQELLHIEADIVGPGPEGFGTGPMDNFHFQYGINVDGSGISNVRLVNSHFENVGSDAVMMENCTVKTVDTPFDIYGQIPIQEVVACFATTLEMKGHASYLADVDSDEFLPYAFFKHDDYRLLMSRD